MDQLWDFFSKHATAFGVIVAALVALGGFAKWLLSRRTDPSSGGGESVHGPKVGRDVGGDATGRDKITMHGDQVGRDEAGGDIVHGDKITQIISGSRDAAVAAARSRFQMPARNPDFEGRREKIEEIKTALRAGAAQVTALEGMGGIGKTDTAVEAAHGVVDEGRFKDAQLFLDLQGFSETGNPLTPIEALRRLLRPFVPADETLPESEQELAGRFQDVTRGLDMLLFLDNARDDEQVEPLLPGHPGCTVLVTSRNRLELRGLKPIDLAEMNPEEAAALALKLAIRRDPKRITPAQASELAKLCGFLPLSIEVTANALSKSRGADVARYLSELDERTKPLKALEKAKAVLRLSADALDAETRARWEALGVFEGGFDAKAAAAVWAVEDAGATLEDLEQRSLVTCEEIGAGEERLVRYHLHDLLRAVALEELKRDAARQHETQRRHAEHYFAVLRMADVLYNAGHDDVGRGLALLDAELANIRAAQRWAAEAMAEDAEAAKLAQDFHHQCLMLRFARDEHLAWLATSLAAAERRCDREGQARAAGNLGMIYGRWGELDRAEEMFHRILTIHEDVRSKEDMARDYCNLGLVYEGRGELDRAEELFRKSLAIDQELGLKKGIAADYSNLGLIYQRRGHLNPAEEMYKQSLAIAEEFGSKEQMARVYTNLGVIYSKQRALDRAEEMFRKGLAIDEHLQRKEGMAANYGNLGNICAQRGDMRQAVAYWRKSLALNREIGARPKIEKYEAALRAAGVDPDHDEAA